MTDLSAEDLDLLRQDGCLVDAEAATEALWDALRVGPLPRAHPWGYISDATRETYGLVAESALRAVGLEPGRPAIGLVLDAIARRGWGLMLTEPKSGTWKVSIFVGGEVGGETCQVFGGRDWDLSVASALALVSAIRAARPEDKTDG